MKTLKLHKPWTYRIPVKTIDFPAGEHEVSNEIHAKAVAEGIITEEKGNGGRASEAGPAGAAGKAQG